MTYTCTVCGRTRTEAIAKLTATASTPVADYTSKEGEEVKTSDTKATYEVTKAAAIGVKTMRSTEGSGVNALQDIHAMIK